MTIVKLAENLLSEMASQDVDLSAASVLMARLCAATGHKAIFVELNWKLICRQIVFSDFFLSIPIPEFADAVTDVVRSYDKKSHDELEARLIANLNKNIPVHETMKEFV